MKTTNELIAKLHTKSTDQALKILWQWIKEGEVTLRQFKEILNRCPYLSGRR